MEPNRTISTFSILVFVDIKDVEVLLILFLFVWAEYLFFSLICKLGAIWMRVEGNGRRRSLTNMLWPMALDDICQLQVAGYDGHLVGRLVGVVQSVPVSAPEQQQPCTRLLAIHRAHMQRSIAGRVACVHVRAVKQQMLEMLDQTVATRLRNEPTPD